MGDSTTSISSRSICSTTTATIYVTWRWRKRREILASMIEPGGASRFSEPLRANKAIYHLVDQAWLEGVISKRRESKCRSGPSTNWLKAKCYSIDEFVLLGVEREAGKPAFALVAERDTGRYVGSAFVTLNREMRERLWKRVKDHPGTAPKRMKRPATLWVQRELIGCVKHLAARKIRDTLRAARFPEDDDNGWTNDFATCTAMSAAADRPIR
ncbi:hypothetical protein NKH19_23135 [Mesorhizobium sp. M1338]|uniref:hypothetical protein n=1 Tax=unclassified Mesorhizobium TaxID=325217 RepID=UPI0033395919